MLQRGVLSTASLGCLGLQGFHCLREQVPRPPLYIFRQWGDIKIVPTATGGSVVTNYKCERRQRFELAVIGHDHLHVEDFPSVEVFICFVSLMVIQCGWHYAWQCGCMCWKRPLSNHCSALAYITTSTRFYRGGQHVALMERPSTTLREIEVEVFSFVLPLI